jgi:hypothetical protein
MALSTTTTSRSFFGGDRKGREGKGGRRKGKEHTQDKSRKGKNEITL